jgi:hypothetical protein
MIKFTFISTSLRGFIASRIILLFFVALLLCSSAALSFAYKLPDTDQTKCYQAISPYAEIPCAATGQDGEYNINPMSYTDHGNGTVKDNNTGLMWQKCSIGQNNDLSCSGTATFHNWFQASGTYNTSFNLYSQSVCGSLNLGGHSDWRLPTKKELISMVDYAHGPTIRPAYFPNTDESLYWSSTTLASNPSYAWYLCIYDGYVVCHGFKVDDYYVRCVRGGQ